MNLSTLLLNKGRNSLFPIILLICFSLSSNAISAQKGAAQTILSEQSENRIYQFLLTDTNNKTSTTEIQAGQQLRSPEGTPVFNFNGTPALKQEPNTAFEKTGLGGINATGTNGNVTLHRIEPKTGKPYLIIIDRATLKTLSKNID